VRLTESDTLLIRPLARFHGSHSPPGGRICTNHCTSAFGRAARPTTSTHPRRGECSRALRTALGMYARRAGRHCPRAAHAYLERAYGGLASPLLCDEVLIEVLMPRLWEQSCIVRLWYAVVTQAARACSLCLHPCIRFPKSEVLSCMGVDTGGEGATPAADSSALGNLLGALHQLCPLAHCARVHPGCAPLLTLTGLCCLPCGRDGHRFIALHFRCMADITPTSHGGDRDAACAPFPTSTACADCLLTRAPRRCRMGTAPASSIACLLPSIRTPARGTAPRHTACRTHRSAVAGRQ